MEILEEVDRQVGFPAAIRVDQGTKFVSRDLDPWAHPALRIGPGRPGMTGPFSFRLMINLLGPRQAFYSTAFPFLSRS